MVPQTRQRRGNAPNSTFNRRGAILLEGPASWLKNKKEDPVWILPELNSPRRDRVCTLRFDYVLPGPSLLTDPENFHLYQIAKAYAVLIREGPFAIAETLSAHTHANLVRNLLTVIGWMRLNNVVAFEALTKSDISSLVSDAAYGVGVQLNVFERIRRSLIRLLEEDESGGVRGLRRGRVDRLTVLREAGLDDTLLSRSRSKSIFSCLEASIKARQTTKQMIAALQELQAPKGTPVTRTELERKLRPLSDLWAARSLLRGDGLKFDPFPDGLSTVAANFGAEVGRTPTVPVRQAMELVDASIRWILDYSEPILAAYETAHILRDTAKLDISSAVSLAVGQIDHAPGGPSAPWPLIKKVRNRTGEPLKLTLPDAVRLLATASVVIIATFTGRRIDEILGITSQCVRGNQKEGFWIRTFIEKTNRRHEYTPCPALVAVAVEKLEKLSRAARGDDIKAELCRWIAIDTSDGRQTRAVNPAVDFNSLASAIPVSKTKDEQTWHFAAHQFRRFFSIAYVWRYQLGDLGALSHHLRHTDVVATKRYVTEAAAGLLIEEEREFTKTILRDAALGKRRLGGAFGERFGRILERETAKFQKKVRIIMPDRLDRWIETFVSTTHILLKSTPWSYCVCPDTVEGGAHANCQKEGESLAAARGSDLAKAAPHVCFGCFHNCTDLIFKPYVQQEKELIERRLDDPSLPRLARNAEEKRLERLRAYLATDFAPLAG